MKASTILNLTVVALASILAYAAAVPEPLPSGYGAPSGYSSGGHGRGWGHHHQPKVQQGWGWEAPRKYLNFNIPIPRLPKISFGINAGIRASVNHGHGGQAQGQGWGWK